MHKVIVLVLENHMAGSEKEPHILSALSDE